jgi:hypothetical protein
MTSKTDTKKRYFILHLDSYAGEGSSLICAASSNDYMFCVLVVVGQTAEIIDYGYSSITELKEAWKDVWFEN